jgi:low temperature requirement protein LtrA
VSLLDIFVGRNAAGETDEITGMELMIKRKLRQTNRSALRRRPTWERPSLIVTDEHRKVSWLELFYDLFFVVTVSQLAHGLVGDVSWEKVSAYVLIFVPVWWIWIGSTFYNERFETQGLDNRLIFFLLMFPVLGLAVFTYDAMGTTAVGFALSYIFGRVIITVLWLRASMHIREFRPTGRIYVAGFTVSILLFVLSLFTSQNLRFVLWGVALLIDMITPSFTLKHQRMLPRFSTSKLPERFGLFILIVLGESIVGVVNGVAAMKVPGFATILPAVFGITIGFSLWWIYFDFINRRPAKSKVTVSIFWVYLHLPMAMGIAATGAGITNIITARAAHEAVPSTILVVVAVGLLLVTIGCTEFTLHREEDEPTHPRLSPWMKILTGVVLVVFANFSDALPTLAALSIVLAGLFIQMIYGAYVWFTQPIPEDRAMEIV